MMRHQATRIVLTVTGTPNIFLTAGLIGSDTEAAGVACREGIPKGSTMQRDLIAHTKAQDLLALPLQCRGARTMAPRGATEPNSAFAPAMDTFFL